MFEDTVDAAVQRVMQSDPKEADIRVEGLLILKGNEIISEHYL